MGVRSRPPGCRRGIARSAEASGDARCPGCSFQVVIDRSVRSSLGLDLAVFCATCVARTDPKSRLPPTMFTLAGATGATWPFHQHGNRDRATNQQITERESTHIGISDVISAESPLQGKLTGLAGHAADPRDSRCRLRDPVVVRRRRATGKAPDRAMSANRVLGYAGRDPSDPVPGRGRFR
jgi:hypothetical protein